MALMRMRAQTLSLTSSVFLTFAEALRKEGPMAADIPMPHPGVVLREEFLEPMGLTVNALAEGHPCHA